MAYRAPIFFLLVTIVVSANPIVLGFESLPGGTPVGGSFPGLTFANAVALTAGISLNEFEFPPHSDHNVAFDEGGPVTVQFANTVGSFSVFTCLYYGHGDRLRSGERPNRFGSLGVDDKPRLPWGSAARLQFSDSIRKSTR